MSNVFLTATKIKLRFPSGRGQLATEDLWDLSLKKLDEMAVAIDASVGERKTFLANPDTQVTLEQAEQSLRLEVLKEVIKTKQDENSAALAASKKRAHKEFLKSLKEKKQLAQMEDLSIEDIDKQLAELEA